MDSLLDAIAGGLRIATRRLHLVLADMVAKFVWLLLTGALFFLALIAFLNRLPVLTNVTPELGGLVLGAQIMQAGPALIRMLLVAGLGSFLVWSVVEAFVRSRIWRSTWGDASDGSGTFGRFLASGILRRVVFASIAATLGLIVLGPGLTDEWGQWSGTVSEMRWAVLTLMMLLVMVAFVLMLVDTLLRCDAVDSLGMHFGTILGAVAAIGFFEVTIRMAALAGTAVMMRILPAQGVVLLVVPVIGFGLSVVHSYLLLARYSAIGIIRHHYSRAPTNNGPSYI